MTNQQKADRFNQKIQQAVDSWVFGNNSGDPDKFARGEELCEQFRASAENELPPGCKVCYPGLYPVVTTPDGREHYEITARVWG